MRALVNLHTRQARQLGRDMAAFRHYQHALERARQRVTRPQRHGTGRLAYRRRPDRRAAGRRWSGQERLTHATPTLDPVEPGVEQLEKELMPPVGGSHRVVYARMTLSS